MILRRRGANSPVISSRHSCPACPSPFFGGMQAGVFSQEPASFVDSAGVAYPAALAAGSAVLAERSFRAVPVAAGSTGR